MAKASVQIMDIYPEMLTDAYELCENVLKDYGYSEQQFFKRFDEELKEFELNNISNRLVHIIFDVTEDMILEKDKNANVDYYINGSLDTHFYINGEEQ